MTISVVIPILNEEKYIKKCLDSIIDSDYPKESMEVLLIDGDSQDKTIEIIKTYQQKYNFIKLLHNPKRITPISMNIGIQYASGDFIFIISAHAFYKNNYFSKLIQQMKSLNADCVGGILVTEVKNKTLKSNSIKLVLSHPLGVGNSDFRVGVDEVKEVDTVPFGCYPKSVFKKYGLYDERLVRNQDIELNKRIINGGGKIYLVPDIECTYYARENFTDLARNNFANGKWNILTAYYTKTLNSLSLRHFVPLLFVLSLILPMLGAIFYTKLIYISLLSLISYIALVIIISIKLSSKDTNIFYLIASFLTLHISYGFGSLAGIWEVLTKGIKWKNN